MNIALWIVYPYVTIAILVGGVIWRYRYDKFGWTTRSSQLYESTILRWGSPLFHFGILLVLLGHIGGLLIPKSWTEAVGVSEHTNPRFGGNLTRRVPLGGPGRQQRRTDRVKVFDIGKGHWPVTRARRVESDLETVDVVPDVVRLVGVR